jgi:hypothetical protein
MAWLGSFGFAALMHWLRKRDERERRKLQRSLASAGKGYGTRGRWVDTPTGRRSW